MSLLEKCKRESVHTRNTKISTFESDQGGIIVEGELIDDRLKSGYSPTGEERSPQIVHHMKIRMWLDGQPLSIKEIEVEMPGIPNKECAETRKSLDRIKGMSIVTGFTMRVKDILGGINGCAHLTALLISMAPVAIQGYWAHYSRKPVDKDLSSDSMRQFLVDTCWVWRKEGPLFKKLLNTVKENQQS
ncbi:MAG: DUF2889 domain-containing protein [Deltaproteobacteria bacterium]|nr:DUF2889 domain-containing protein [Deltaproteobacteria bacterium]